ncbi:hypothetical protein BHM03_00013856 [Ensete ventricosum]|nr:hypothetical protein BHM03_00013856 [Ensete ventricosum]
MQVLFVGSHLCLQEGTRSPDLSSFLFLVAVGIAHSSSSGLGSNYLVSCSYLQRIERNGKDDGEEMHLNRGRNRTQEFDLSDNSKPMFRSGRRARSRELDSDGKRARCSLAHDSPARCSLGKRRKLLRRLRRRDPFRRRGNAMGYVILCAPEGSGLMDPA